MIFSAQTVGRGYCIFPGNGKKYTSTHVISNVIPSTSTFSFDFRLSARPKPLPRSRTTRFTKTTQRPCSKKRKSSPYRYLLCFGTAKRKTQNLLALQLNKVCWARASISFVLHLVVPMAVAEVQQTWFKKSWADDWYPIMRIEYKYGANVRTVSTFDQQRPTASTPCCP